MENYTISGNPDVSAGNEFAHQIINFQYRYNRLLNVLGRNFSEISVHRMDETDQDIRPKHFVRFAIHEFIYPPQEVDLYDNPQAEYIGQLPGTFPYTLTVTDKVSEYDMSMISGKLKVFYSDSESFPSLSLIDLFNAETGRVSEFPLAMQPELNEVFDENFNLVIPVNLIRK